MDEWLKQQIEKLKIRILLKPYKCGLEIFFVLLAIPLLTWVAYYIGDCGIVLVRTSLEIGDALGFYGAFLTFLGTVVFSALAIKQNINANKISNRLLYLEEQRYKELEAPILKLVYHGVDDNNQGSMIKAENLYYYTMSEEELTFQESNQSSNYYIELHLKNVSDVTCFDISISKASIVKSMQKKIYVYENIAGTVSSTDGILPNKEVRFIIFTNKEFLMEYVKGNYQIIQFEITMVNKNGRKFIEILQFGLKYRQKGTWQSSRTFEKDIYDSNYSIDYKRFD